MDASKVEEQKVVDDKNINTFRQSLIDWLKFFLILGVLLVILLNTVGLTKVSGFSMYPTLNDGDLVFVNKLERFTHDPELGDVAIMSLKSEGINIVKRIIGVPGDTVFIKSGIIYVNNKPVPEISTNGTSDDMAQITVPKNKLFVVGDNREPGISFDSRSKDFGFIPIKDIKGYVLISILPIHKIAKPLKV
ncbi:MULTISPECIES: signal peptidase I [unclassified Bacillus (in: firmicutes)]|uniref:signal peptidase I n=1 Tax=unclassified Bacillus (in: firmicutes) TaxID=185979 RepID=UPI000BF19F54|nr:MULTISPECIES: signal peptidase I [unclassified Bacillus (in: firmicutes)]PEJ58431.1 signal peptidase I [Bacillus sp. AFS002410]PEL07006.1 signal peptidase I [Bacillus sp. AFS017336]